MCFYSHSSPIWWWQNKNDRYKDQWERKGVDLLFLIVCSWSDRRDVSEKQFFIWPYHCRLFLLPSLRKTNYQESTLESSLRCLRHAIEKRYRASAIFGHLLLGVWSMLIMKSRRRHLLGSWGDMLLSACWNFSLSHLCVCECAQGCRGERLWHSCAEWEWITEKNYHFTGLAYSFLPMNSSTAIDTNYRQ